MLIKYPSNPDGVYADLFLKSKVMRSYESRLKSLSEKQLRLYCHMLSKCDEYGLSDCSTYDFGITHRDDRLDFKAIADNGLVKVMPDMNKIVQGRPQRLFYLRNRYNDSFFNNFITCTDKKCWDYEKGFTITNNIGAIAWHSQVYSAMKFYEMC